MKYFKVKYGFGTMDSASVEEGDLKRVLYAQLKGTPVQIGNAVVNGKNIISITPDYNKYTGWNENYEPKDSEDWEQIKRDCPDFNGVLEYHKEQLMYLLKTEQTNLISKKDEYRRITEPETQNALVGEITSNLTLNN